MNTRAAAVFFLMLLPLCPHALYPEQTRLSAVIADGRIRAGASLEGVSGKMLLDPVREGLTAEIVFQFRLYRVQKGLRALFGDRLLVERRFVRLGSMDAFEHRFLIRDDDGRTERCRGDEDFARQFFRLEDVDLGYLAREGPQDYYVLARIRYSPVRLVPPLNLISLLTHQTMVTTGWAEVGLERAVPGGPGENLP